MTRQLISFKKFLEERPDLFFTNTVPLKEDLSGKRKKSKMVELEKLLKKMDFYYQYIDGGGFFRASNCIERGHDSRPL